MRNVSRGLASRTKIIEIMEKGKNNIPEISENLLKQRVVTASQSGRVGRWTLTKYGQEKLFSSS